MGCDVMGEEVRVESVWNGAGNLPFGFRGLE